MDFKTKYILDVYTGSTSVTEFDPKLEKSGNIVLTLTEPYWNKKHVLFTDNWYTSPLLCYSLYGKKTNCWRTVKATRQFMPQFQKKSKKRMVQYFSIDTLLAIKWTDKRDVHMLKTIHKHEMEVVSSYEDETREKPMCIIDYNEHMDGVDRTDMLLSSIESICKSVKWHMKVFFHIMDWVS